MEILNLGKKLWQQRKSYCESLDRIAMRSISYVSWSQPLEIGQLVPLKMEVLTTPRRWYFMLTGDLWLKTKVVDYMVVSVAGRVATLKPLKVLI